MTRRIALLAALPFPLPQGSQVYVAGQARALARAGVDVTLLCYGHGEREGADAEGTLAALRAAGVTPAPAPARLSRTPLGAGPSARKPLADAALLATLLAAERRLPFDAVLAHNVEAACIALAARPVTGTPVVYVAHTLFGNELSSYVPARLARAADAIGRRLDHLVARQADAVVALSSAAAKALAAAARRRVAHVLPALDPEPPPPREEVVAACRRHGLEAGGFVLYAGNLDAYQDLALLADAARRPGVGKVIVVSHDPTRVPPSGLSLVRARDAAEVRVLVFGAAVTVVPRRIVGGFPIKLLNYMEAGRAIVGFEGVADGLRHGLDAWLLPRRAGADDLAEALRRLQRERTLAARLGAAARRLLDARFGWAHATEQTLAVVSAAIETRRARPARSAARLLRPLG